MAKKHNHKFDGSVMTYEIPGTGAATLDLSKVFPDFLGLPPVAQEMVKFSAKTLARNATAGLMDDADKPTALKRIQERFKNFMEGVYRSGGGAESAERPTSMLARALAEAQAAINPNDPAATPEGAAAMIAGLIDANVQKAELSPDEDDDKEAIRKIASAVRKAIADTAEVAPILARIKAEEAQKRADAAAKPKEGAVSLGTLLQR